MTLHSFHSGGGLVTTRAAPRAATADLLLGLLSEHDSYRRLWRAHMDRTPVAAVQQSAVARVLAEHLWESGQIDESDDQLPRRLKDTVARALSGRHLSPRTLRLFVEAFSISQGHRAQLWRSLENELGQHPLGPVPGPSLARPGDPRARDWEPTLLHEQVSITPQGQLARRQVVLVVRALDLLTRVRLPVAPARERVVVRHGLMPGPAATGAGCEDLQLAEPLPAGEAALLRYDLLPVVAAPITEVRTDLDRVGASSTVILQVHFHPGRLPGQVWRRRWPGQAPETSGERQATRLGPRHDVQQVVSGLCEGALGFSWQW